MSDRQCSSCGGFCGRGGCKRENVKPEQKPVAVVTSQTGDPVTMSWHHEPALPIGTKLYAAPPARKPLTNEEIANLWDGHIVPVFGKNGINPIVFARAIERAHGIGEP